MDTTKFKSLFPTILKADNLEDSLLDHFFLNPQQRNFGYESKTTENGWELILPIPGASKEDVSVDVVNNQLVIEASGGNVWEKNQTRKFRIPHQSDTENIEGEMKNGILTLFVPKKKSFAGKTVKIK